MSTFIIKQFWVVEEAPREKLFLIKPVMKILPSASDTCTSVASDSIVPVYASFVLVQNFIFLRAKLAYSVKIIIAFLAGIAFVFAYPTATNRFILGINARLLQYEWSPALTYDSKTAFSKSPRVEMRAMKQESTWSALGSAPDDETL